MRNNKVTLVALWLNLTPALPFALLWARDKHAAPELKNEFVGTQPGV